MQIWPWWKNEPKLAAATARSRSASGSTTSGALPPSSSSTRLRCRAAFSATIRPTRVEPVKLTRRTAGWAISSSTTSAASAGAFTIRFTTPAGTPASSRAVTIAACVRGHSSDAFSTTVLPSASGEAIARVPRITGAFHGAIPTTTPTGWRTARAFLPGTCDSIWASCTSDANAPAACSMPDASSTLNMPQPKVAPVSSVTIPAISAWRSISSSAARSSRARRSATGVAAHAGKASAAASTAARASSRVAAEALPADSPLYGFVFS